MSLRRPFFIASVLVCTSFYGVRLGAQPETTSSSEIVSGSNLGAEVSDVQGTSGLLNGESVGIDSVVSDPSIHVTGTRYGEFKLRASPILVDSLFPADSIVQERSRFWFQIYCQVGEGEGLIHDGKFMSIVYQKIQAPHANSRAGRKWIDAALHSVEHDLLTLASTPVKSADPVLTSLRSILPAHWDSTDFKAAAERLRFQRGLKERFLAGVIRSYRWLPEIESTMVSRGLPKRLKYLPHVESSFQPFAYSKVGAAGMWQFMKTTGRRYGMKSTYLIDERRDPVRSTDGAARLLGDAHSLLGAWPLALTAYNHGPSGVKRAVASVGSNRLDDIIRLYDGKRFGFASSNFYAEFLAASSIGMQADSLFPGHFKDLPQPTVVFELPKPVRISDLIQWSGLTPAELETHNLSLRPAVFRSRSTLPKGTRIHLPQTLDRNQWLAKWKGDGKDVSLALASNEVDAPQDKARVAQSEKNHSELNGEKLASVSTKESNPMKQDEKPEKTLIPTVEKTKNLAREARRDSKTGLVQNQETNPSASLKSVTPPGLARALDSLPTPNETMASTSNPGSTEMPKSTTLGDAGLALMAVEPGDWVHPFDRFDPTVYHLSYRQENGWLYFESGPEETLSHYSEWSGLSGSQIRKWNRIGNRRALNMARSLRLPLDSSRAAHFIRSREENYRAVEEDFYGSYHVTLLEAKRVTAGFNVWSLAVDNDLPYWLIQKHNPKRDLATLHPGDTVQFPVVEPGLRRWGFTRYIQPEEPLQKMVERLSPLDSAHVLR